MNFFNELYDRASQVGKLLEESQNERSHQLLNMERMFKVILPSFVGDFSMLAKLNPDLVHYLETGRGSKRGESSSRKHCNHISKCDIKENNYGTNLSNYCFSVFPDLKIF